jgi:membrane-associated protease RseP (regulator of RpoE activity)
LADETEAEEERADAPAAARVTAPPLFDVAALVAGGCMRRTDAETLRARWERYELDRLDVNDRAMRSSYFMTPRHRNEQAALEAAFRDELGEEGYDAYLRATGKPNRFALREVLAGGAGSAAGLEAGDELVRYDGVRVFSTADLQLLTSAGRPGELVALEVIRGGQPTTLRAARGPLGVVLEGVVRAPEAGCSPS